MNLLRRNLEEILVDHDEVGGLAGLDGAGLVLLLHDHRTVSGEDRNRGLDADPRSSGLSWPYSGLPGYWRVTMPSSANHGSGSGMLSQSLP